MTVAITSSDVYIQKTTQEFPETRRGGRSYIFDGLSDSEIEALRLSGECCSSSEQSAMPGFSNSTRYSTDYELGSEITTRHMLVDQSDFSMDADEASRARLQSAMRPRRSSRHNRNIEPGFTNDSSRASTGIETRGPGSHNLAEGTISQLGSTNSSRRDPEDPRPNHRAVRRGALGNIFNDTQKKKRV